MANKPRVPSGGRAVVERHAPTIVEADEATRARWRALDWFATPPFASRAGARLIREIDPDAKAVAEPACGDGIMSRCLEEEFPHVFASDLEPQKRAGSNALKMDFLQCSLGYEVDWIITNPPFQHAEEFVRVGLKVARRGVAVLCRLAFLESVGRASLHYPGLSILAPFCERVPMQLGPWNPSCSTATAYAWFIYGKDDLWRKEAIVRAFMPGTRAALSKADDVRRFSEESEAPLLDFKP